MIRGIKLYRQQQNYTDILNLLNDIKINTLYMSKELAQDSRFLKTVPKLIQKALIFPFLYDCDGDLNDKQDNWAILQDGTKAKEEWVEFICPNATELLDDKINRYIQYAEDAGVEIFSIDFIRYFAFWEKTSESNAGDLKSSCFCQHCMEEFAHYSRLELPNLKRSEISLYILNKHNEQFTRYRCEKIVSLVKEVRRRVKERIPSIKISLHLVPWLGGEYDNALQRITAQSIEKLSPYVDILTPMCYHFMLHKSSNWISDYLLSLDKQSSATMLPSLQVSNCYRSETLTVQEFEKSLNAVKKGNCENFLLWSGEMLLLSQEKQEVVKKFT